ncbi:MAG TPA: hypothetical protein VLN49_10625 [Gemmatimonadaceae bacterium]|nr:hypothetical protein [Gemmatimonadaceae bacterium]
MIWKIGLAASTLACMVGCSAARPTSEPTPNASAAATPLSLESIAGQYQLVAIDGQALPVAPAKKGDAATTASWTVVGGTLLVRSNGTFQVETNYDTKGDTRDNSSYKFSGTCFSAGTVVRMVWDGGGQTDLRLRGDTVVVDNQGTAFSYLRR